MARSKARTRTKAKAKAKAKMKTHRGMAKRLKLTKNKKLLAQKPRTAYHYRLVSNKRKRQARRGLELVGRQRKRLMQRLDG